MYSTVYVFLLLWTLCHGLLSFSWCHWWDRICDCDYFWTSFILIFTLITVSCVIQSTLVISTSWVTAFEVKIWSLFNKENLTTGSKILWKRREIVPWEQFLLFSTIHCIFNISLTRSQITYSFMKWSCSIYFFLNPANLICLGLWGWGVGARGVFVGGGGEFFRESLGHRDNKSRRYLVLEWYWSILIVIDWELFYMILNVIKKNLFSGPALLSMYNDNKCV